MEPAVTLMFANGSLRNRRHTFTHPALIVVGRGRDCELSLPAGLEFSRVSRRHCLLHIDPPNVRVRDLESTNGTFVNGVRIGDAGERLESLDQDGCIWRRLRHSDEINIGDTYLRMLITESNDDACRNSRSVQTSS